MATHQALFTRPEGGTGALAMLSLSPKRVRPYLCLVTRLFLLPLPLERFHDNLTKLMRDRVLYLYIPA